MVVDENHLVRVWENCFSRMNFERGAGMLRIADKRLTDELVSTWTIGERDQLLFWIYVKLFDRFAESTTTCNSCDLEIESKTNVHDFIDVNYEPESQGEYQVGDQKLTLKPVTQGDLVDLNRMGEQLWISTKYQNLADVEVIGEHLGSLDPLADICIEIECENCGNRWLESFDIVSHLWQKLDTFCRKLLSSVHALAKAYGWTEREVLSMTSWRRQVYLNMAGAG